MDKYLYHRNNLYNIIKEHTNNYHLERFNKISVEKHLTPINFKIESSNNYYMFGKYNEKGILNRSSKLFNKSQREYIIIDKFNVIDNILIILNNNNIFFQVLYFAILLLIHYFHLLLLLLLYLLPCH